MAYSFTTYLERIKKFGSTGQTVDAAFLQAQKEYIRDLQKRLNDMLLKNDLGKTLLNDKDFAGIELTGQWDGNLKRILEAIENLNKGDDAAKKAAKADLAKRAGDQISKFHASYTAGQGGQSILLGERATEAVNKTMPALDAIGTELDEIRTFQKSGELKTFSILNPITEAKRTLSRNGKMTVEGIDAFADDDTNTDSWQLGLGLMKARLDMQKFINAHRSEALVAKLPETGDQSAQLYRGMDRLIKAGVEFPEEYAYLKELWPSYKKLTEEQLNSADHALIFKMKDFVNIYATAGEAQAANSSQKALPNVPRLDTNRAWPWWATKERESFYAIQGYLNQNSASSIREHMNEANPGKADWLRKKFNGTYHDGIPADQIEFATKYLPHMKEAFKLKNAAIDAKPIAPDPVGKAKPKILELKEVILAGSENKIDIELNNNPKDLFLAEQVRNMAVTAQKTAQALAQNNPAFAAEIGVPPEKLFSPEFVDGAVGPTTRKIMKKLIASPPEGMLPGQIQAYGIIVELTDRQIKTIQSTPVEEMPKALGAIEKYYAYTGTDKRDAARYSAAVKSIQTDIKGRAEFFGNMLEHGPNDVKKALREITGQLKQFDQYKDQLDKHILIDYLKKMPINGQMGTDGTDPVATICKILPRLKDTHIQWNDRLMEASWHVDDLQMSVSGMTGSQGRAFAKNYTAAVLASDETKTNVWHFENFHNKYIDAGDIKNTQTYRPESNYKKPAFLHAVENATATFKNYVENLSDAYAQKINESLPEEKRVPDLAQRLKLFAGKPDKDGLLNDNDQYAIGLLKAHKDKLVGLNQYVFDYIDHIETLGPAYPHIQNRIMASRLSSYEEIENKTDDDIENNMCRLLARGAIKRFTGKSSFDPFNPKDNRIAGEGVRAIDGFQKFIKSIPSETIIKGIESDPDYIIAKLKTCSQIPGFEIPEEVIANNGLPTDLFNEKGEIIIEKLTKDTATKLQNIYNAKLAEIEDEEFKNSIQGAIIANLPEEKQQLAQLPEMIEKTEGRPLPFILQMLTQIFSNPVFVKETPGASKIRDKLSDVSTIMALANENKAMADRLIAINTPPKDPAANAPPPPPGTTETTTAGGTTQTSGTDTTVDESEIRRQWLINSGLLTPAKKDADEKTVSFNENNKDVTAEKTKTATASVSSGGPAVTNTRPMNVSS